MALRSSDLDKLVLEALKDAHNRGADLYNAGDPAGAFRLYQGALVVAGRFVTHHPATHRGIADGLGEVAAADVSDSLKAFRLHEVIDQVRADLKAHLRNRDGSPTDRIAELAAAKLTGIVVVAGLVAPRVTVTLTVPGDPLTTASAVTDDHGRFLLTALPGPYRVTLDGPGVPAGFAAAATSPLRTHLPAGGGAVEFRVLG